MEINNRAYPALSNYLLIAGEERDERSPVDRLRDLKKTLARNGVHGERISAPVRHQDKNSVSDYQQQLGGHDVVIQKPDEHRALEDSVRGLVERAARAFLEERGHMKVEPEMTRYDDVIAALQKAVSDKLGKEVIASARRTRDYGGELVGVVEFVEKLRAQEKWELLLPEFVQKGIAALVKGVTGQKTVHPDDKSFLENSKNPQDFLRNYFNEWVGFKYPLEIEETVADVAREQVQKYGVLIRHYEDFYPSRLRAKVCPQEIAKEIEDLNRIADEANASYRLGTLSNEKFLKLLKLAQEICCVL